MNCATSSPLAPATINMFLPIARDCSASGGPRPCWPFCKPRDPELASSQLRRYWLARALTEPADHASPGAWTRTVPFSTRYRWRMGETEGRERRWSGNLWRLRHVAPTAATSPTCARTNRPHRSRRLSQRQPLSDPARHAWDDLRGWPLRRSLSQAGSASLSTLAPGPDHADAVPRGLE